MEEVIKEQEEFFEYIENSITKNKKVSHAYLIETNGYEKYNIVIKGLVKKILLLNMDNDQGKKTNLCNQIDNNNYPDLKIINPDGFWIKKEQLLSLEEEYSKKSMLDNKLVYIIDPADRLNDSSANTILKFLEEPPDNIVAILLTENKYNVLETIVSRCQTLTLKNASSVEIDEVIKKFVLLLKEPKKLLIEYDHYFENLFSDKNTAQSNIKKIEEVLFFKLNEDIKQDKEIDLKIVSNIELLEEEKHKLQYNLNMKLWFSSFIFRLLEVSRHD